MPLSTRLKAREVRFVLERCSARTVCTVEEFLGTRYAAALDDAAVPGLRTVVALDGGGEAALPWQEFLARAATVSEAEIREVALAVAPGDLSDVIFTSGTTGRPKGVMTAHGQNLRAFETWSDLVGLRAGDRYLIVNPFSHSFGYKAGWLACLLRGATALPQAVFDVPEVLARIARDRITVLPGPPTLYQMILAHPERRAYDLSTLRLAVTGAAAIPVELIHRMRRELGFDTVLTAYGLTESCGVVTMCRAGDPPETVAQTSGRPIPGVELRLVDRDGGEVAPGEPGEVLVRGYNVMQGYLDEPEETARAIDADGWLHTGDVGVRDEDGNLRITDRIKDMYIAGGFNCYPAEIEGLIYGSGLVSQIAVIGVPDERLGEVGMAFAVPAPGSALTPDTLVAWCRENMANYKVPRYVELVDGLPTNAAGKVTKPALRERAAELLGRTTESGRRE